MSVVAGKVRSVIIFWIAAIIIRAFLENVTISIEDSFCEYM